MVTSVMLRFWISFLRATSSRARKTGLELMEKLQGARTIKDKVIVTI